MRPAFWRRPAPAPRRRSAGRWTPAGATCSWWPSGASTPRCGRRPQTLVPGDGATSAEVGSPVMSEEPEPPHEQFPLWLAAYDEALAAGGEPSHLQDVPGEHRPRLEREASWCRFVREHLP